MCKNNTRKNNNNNNKELTHIWIHPPFNRMIHLLVPKIKSQDLFVFFCQTILLFQMRNLKHSVGCWLFLSVHNHFPVASVEWNIEKVRCSNEFIYCKHLCAKRSVASALKRRMRTDVEQLNGYRFQIHWNRNRLQIQSGR